MTNNETHLLENSQFKIFVASHGAELQSIFDKNQQLELLWQGDTTYWGRRAPLLFPIVGRLKNDILRYQHQEFRMTQHGFARDSLFEMIYQSDSQLEFRLRASSQTKISYPFEFEIIVSYFLINNVLQIDYVIRNQNECELPFSIGGHPAFNCPLLPVISKQQHTIEFECNELAHTFRLDSGLLKKEKQSSPVVDRLIHLDDNSFNNDALIFDGLFNRKLHYHAGNQYTISLEFSDFPQLALWSKPGAPFICLEPWYGYASPVDFDDDIRKKPGIILLPSNAEIQLRYQLEFKKH